MLINVMRITFIFVVFLYYREDKLRDRRTCCFFSCFFSCFF